MQPLTKDTPVEVWRREKTYADRRPALDVILGCVGRRLLRHLDNESIEVRDDALAARGALVALVTNLQRVAMDDFYDRVLDILQGSSTRPSRARLVDAVNAAWDASSEEAAMQVEYEVSL